MRFSEFQKSQNIYNKRYLNDKNSLDVILRIVQKINRTLVLDEVLKLVLESAISITNCERGFILLMNNNSELEFKVGLNAKGESLDKDLFKVSTTVVEEVFKTGTSHFIESAQSDTNGKPSKSIYLLELQTILCSPLITEGKKIGVIYVDSRSINKINIKEITDTFEILAGHAAIAIENAQLFNGQMKAYQELKKKNEELRKAKTETEKSDRLKSAFLTQISHEIRTPIHILLSHSELIKEELANNIDNETRDSLSAMKIAGQRIIRTMDLTINMAEIQTGTYRPAPSEVKLSKDILQPIYELFKTDAKRKGIQFLFDIHGEDPIINADRYSLEQIFNNLVDNAIKFTDKGSVTIDICQDKIGRTKVEIADTGIGISKHYIPRLFGTFSQEDYGYCRKFDGNGLGLALVKKYCEINDAELHVSSEKGKGSIFTVVFNN